MFCVPIVPTTLTGIIAHPEGVDQVVDAPSDDHVVVAADDDGDHGRPDADATKPGVDHVPDPVGPLPELLPCGQLKEDQWHAFQDHHDQKWEDESTWKKTFVTATAISSQGQQK